MSFTVALVADEDVLRGDVAMDDAERFPVAFELVGRVQTGAGVREDPHDDPHRDRLARALHHVAEDVERPPGDVLHHQVEDVVDLAELEDADDVRVVDARGELGLVEEHLLERRIGPQLDADRLDGDARLEPARARSAARARPRRSRRARARARARTARGVAPDVLRRRNQTSPGGD